MVDGKLQPRSFNVGSNTTQKEAREMSDVQMRLAHMDELEIDTQVLYPTLYLRPLNTDRASPSSVQVPSLPYRYSAPSVLLLRL